MKFFSLKTTFLLLITGVVALTSCKKTETVYEYYTVPATYNFTDADYSEATARVNMWSGLTTYLGKGTSRQLSQDTADYLWNNTNSAFTTELIVNLQNTKDALNSSAFKLSDKTVDAAAFKKLIDSAVKLSESRGATASEGVPGKVGTRLVNYTGSEFNQLVAKGLMGAFQMSAVIEHLNKVLTDDNTTLISGRTAMQKDWDMAFGYASLPKTYDSSIQYANTVLDRPLGIGGYYRERGRYIQAGGKIYEAFLKGRAAIGAKDYATRNQAIATIKEYLEKTLAAACYEYANVGISGSDLAAKFHGLSEGYGFVLALKYRQAGSALTDANYLKLVDNFKTSFYTLTADATNAKMNEVKAILTAAYGQLQP
ncbi:DUF4856 domain-containing protein [Ferruginibacter sp. SUN002]|uniref:DUF4856 domain-containing protein n=1 Tax=Ferruginibacter sp. SUN002 TaxID=2937789 RepID=UPI003D3655E6